MSERCGKDAWFYIHNHGLGPETLKLEVDVFADGSCSAKLTGFAVAETSSAVIVRKQEVMSHLNQITSNDTPSLGAVAGHLLGLVQCSQGRHQREGATLYGNMVQGFFAASLGEQIQVRHSVNEDRLIVADVTNFILSDRGPKNFKKVDGGFGIAVFRHIVKHCGIVTTDHERKKVETALLEGGVDALNTFQKSKAMEKRSHGTKRKAAEENEAPIKRPRFAEAALLPVPPTQTSPMPTPTTDAQALVASRFQVLWHKPYSDNSLCQLGFADDGSKVRLWSGDVTRLEIDIKAISQVENEAVNIGYHTALVTGQVYHEFTFLEGDRAAKDQRAFHAALIHLQNVARASEQPPNLVMPAEVAHREDRARNFELVTDPGYADPHQFSSSCYPVSMRGRLVFQPDQQSLSYSRYRSAPSVQLNFSDIKALYGDYWIEDGAEYLQIAIKLKGRIQPEAFVFQGSKAVAGAKLWFQAVGEAFVSFWTPSPNKYLHPYGTPSSAKGSSSQQAIDLTGDDTIDLTSEEHGHGEVVDPGAIITKSQVQATPTVETTDPASWYRNCLNGDKGFQKCPKREMLAWLVCYAPSYLTRGNGYDKYNKDDIVKIMVLWMEEHPIIDRKMIDLTATATTFAGPHTESGPKVGELMPAGFPAIDDMKKLVGYNFLGISNDRLQAFLDVHFREKRRYLNRDQMVNVCKLIMQISYPATSATETKESDASTLSEKKFNDYLLQFRIALAERGEKHIWSFEKDQYKRFLASCPEYYRKQYVTTENPLTGEIKKKLISSRAELQHWIVQYLKDHPDTSNQITTSTSAEAESQEVQELTPKVELAMGHNRRISEAEFEQLFYSFRNSWSSAKDGELELWVDADFDTYDVFLKHCPDKYRKPCNTMVEMQAVIVEYLQDYPVSYI